MPNHTLRHQMFCALSLMGLPLFAQAAIAPNTLPTNGSVVSGQASAAIANNQLQVTIGSGSTIIDWGGPAGARSNATLI
ncbi:MAG: hypothetical protein OWQ56_11385 [Acidithiobacillus caldus]|nr:hypothetical protein [Acidithiobacillus caldus]